MPAVFDLKTLQGGTIGALRAHIIKSTGIKKDFVIMHERSVCEDDRTLASYNITNESDVYVLPRTVKEEQGGAQCMNCGCTSISSKAYA